MTVAELIAELQKIEDQSLRVGIRLEQGPSVTPVTGVHLDGVYWEDKRGNEPIWGVELY